MMKFSMQNSCNFLWSLSILNEMDCEIFQMALDNYYTYNTWRMMQMRTKHQVCICVTNASIFQKKKLYDKLDIRSEILLDLDKFWKMSRFDDNNPYYSEIFDIVIIKILLMY